MFFLIYIFFITLKIFIFNVADLARLYDYLFILGVMELGAWLFISRYRYRQNSVSTGLQIFFIVTSVYVTAPIIAVAYGLEIFPFQDFVIKSALTYQSIALSNLFLLIHLFISPKQVEMANLSISKWLVMQNPRKIGGVLFTVIGIALALMYLYIFYSSGVVALIGNESRVNITKAVETGKTWLIQYLLTSWVMALCTVTLFREEKLGIPKLQIALQIAVVGVFMYIYISLGNRRELAILMIFLLLVSILRQRRLFQYIILSMFPVLLSLGMLRALMGELGATPDVQTNILNFFGEFIFPHYPLIYYAGLSNFEFQYGRSFLMLPLYIIPGFDVWDKPISLGLNFSAEYAASQMGYAITPFAEGYINFGWAAVLIVPFFLATTIFLIIRLARKVPAGLIILLSFPLDISRGEFASIGFQWLIFTITFTMLVRIYRYPAQRGLH